MGKKQWQMLEEDCCAWLSATFGDVATFALGGGSNSHTSDILAMLPNGLQFWIEVKSPGSQCSQFVLFPDDESGRFEYSRRNDLELNPFTLHLIEYMDRHYEQYCNPAKPIDLAPNLAEAIGHIRYQHMIKGVEFFITRKETGAYVLIPLSMIGYYYDVRSVYRRKVSGSRSLPKAEDETIGGYYYGRYGIAGWRDERAYVADLDTDYVGDAEDIGGSRYQWSDIGGGLMELRKLSTTANPNIIFTLSLRPDAEGLPHDFFRRFLRFVGRR